MSVYMIIQTEKVTDPEKYQEYASKAKPILESFGGRYLVSTEKIKPLGGGWNPLKVLIIEFPNEEKFSACFNSPEYKAIVQLRLDSLVGQSILVESL